ncbi:MAG: hypothetical protein KME11_06400 [Timaviella obliquedivisa GSE-PSE-MK23-08B]|jgi:hypothetical protein|nr:hypothetical protein [Timaviella obliquedivisa GSE-PSE-MK23-08B]
MEPRNDGNIDPLFLIAEAPLRIENAIALQIKAIANLKNESLRLRIPALLNESMNLLKAPFLQERGWGEVYLAALATQPNP